MPDDSVEAARRQWAVGGAESQEERPAVGFRPGLAEVTYESVSYPGFDGQRLLAPTLRTDDSELIMRPVEILKLQPPNLA